LVSFADYLSDKKVCVLCYTKAEKAFKYYLQISSKLYDLKVYGVYNVSETLIN